MAPRQNFNTRSNKANTSGGYAPTTAMRRSSFHTDSHVTCVPLVPPGRASSPAVHHPAPEDRAHTTPPLTVGMAFVRNLLSGVRAKGLDDAHVTLQLYGELLHVLMLRLDDETLGFLTRRSKPGSSLLQARSALGAPHLETAMRRIAHVFGLLHDDVSLRVLQSGGEGGLGLAFHDTQVQRNPFLHEFLLRAYWRLFAWLVGGELPPTRVDFAFPRPHYSAGLGRIFPAPWRFDAPMSAIWFEARHLQAPVCRDEAALAAYLKEGPVQIVLPRRDHGVCGRVRLHLQRSQPQWPDLDRTAQALALSAATLQRHLSAELGFADSSSFQHAFKGWTGSPPGRYRRGG